MTTNDLKELCGIYKEEIINGDTDRYLMMLAKEIERQTRHDCASLAYQLANSITNMHKDT